MVHFIFTMIITILGILIVSTFKVTDLLKHPDQYTMAKGFRTINILLLSLIICITFLTVAFGMFFVDSLFVQP